MPRDAGRRGLRAGRAGQIVPDDFRYGESAKVPGYVSLANRNYMNLLELPVLFYVICLMLFVSGKVDQAFLTLAWTYVGLRVLHTLVHVTYNHVYHRLALFVASNIVITTMNSLLLFSVFALGIWLWLPGIVTAGAIAVSAALVMRLQGMSHWVMWEFSALFENIGTVRDGIGSLSLPAVVNDKPNARPIARVNGDIRFARDEKARVAPINAGKPDDYEGGWYRGFAAKPAEPEANVAAK